MYVYMCGLWGFIVHVMDTESNSVFLFYCRVISFSCSFCFFFIFHFNFQPLKCERTLEIRLHVTCKSPSNSIWTFFCVCENRVHIYATKNYTLISTYKKKWIIEFNTNFFSKQSFELLKLILRIRATRQFLDQFTEILFIQNLPKLYSIFVCQKQFICVFLTFRQADWMNNNNWFYQIRSSAAKAINGLYYIYGSLPRIRGRHKFDKNWVIPQNV